MNCLVKGLGRISIAILCACSLATSARAQVQLQEDFSGTNIWNAPASILDAESQIDASLLSRVEQLSADLENASISCDDALDCQELELVIEQVNDFLSNLTDAQIEQLRSLESLRIW